jgi:hypothetical protein
MKQKQFDANANPECAGGFGGYIYCLRHFLERAA